MLPKLCKGNTPQSYATAITTTRVSSVNLIKKRLGARKNTSLKLIRCRVTMQKRVRSSKRGMTPRQSKQRQGIRMRKDGSNTRWRTKKSAPTSSWRLNKRQRPRNFRRLSMSIIMKWGSSEMIKIERIGIIGTRLIGWELMRREILRIFRWSTMARTEKERRSTTARVSKRSPIKSNLKKIS